MNTLLVDGNNLIFRAHFAHPTLTGPLGPTSVLFGGMAMLAEATTKVGGRLRLIMLWDSPRDGNTWRARLYPAYKSNRTDSEDRTIALEQLPKLRRILNNLLIEQYMSPGLEADDLIGILSRHLSETGHVFILSKDSDLLQLVRKNVTVLWPKSGGGVDYVDRVGVRALQGVFPRHIPSLKALAGDKADNVKVLHGIGPKRALAMLADGLDPRHKWEDLPRGARGKYQQFEALWPKVRIARRVTKVVIDPAMCSEMVDDVQATQRRKRGRLEHKLFNRFCVRNNIRSLSSEWLGKLW